MKIHNQVEELVIETVDEVFGEIENTNENGQCYCDQCRLDVACYVLNRVPPRYIISERGFAHMDAENSLQQKADLITLINGGMSRVSHSKRPNFPHRERDEIVAPEGPFFNFPVIKGRAFHGATFSPLQKSEVMLSCSDATMRMANANWQNPFPLTSQVSGRFGYWPAPISADSIGETKTFDFAVVVQGEGLDEMRRFFQLTVVATEGSEVSPRDSYSLEDLYVFPNT